MEYGPDKEKIYYQLFTLLLSKKRYYEASKVLDSLPDSYLSSDTSMEKYISLKPVLKKYVKYTDIKNIEDSFMLMASYFQSDKEGYLKSLIKKNYAVLKSNLKFKKQQVMYDDALNLQGGTWDLNDKKNVESGIRGFKELWGNRKNVDNWRRKYDINFNDGSIKDGYDDFNSSYDSLNSETYEAFSKKFTEQLPLTEEKKKKSDSIVAESLYNLAEIYYLNLKNSELANACYDTLLLRYPNSIYDEEVFLNKFFALKQDYSFENKESKKIRSEYLKKYPNGKYVNLFASKNVVEDTTTLVRSVDPSVR